MAFLGRFRSVLLVVVFLLAAGGAFLAYKMRLPKPQGSFAEAQLAPDFTLNDQDGHPFKLSDQRGSELLLIFYRGYW
jgi:cytochrome oxidase Cu insertion factor (SCO1/SenC/PrrC family)